MLVGLNGLFVDAGSRPVKAPEGEAMSKTKGFHNDNYKAGNLKEVPQNNNLSLPLCSEESWGCDKHPCRLANL
jgi:hypothetical protein